MQRGGWVVIASVVALAAGCAGSGDESASEPSATVSESPSPTPVPTYEPETLVDALPSKGEVPGAQSREQDCENGAVAECLRNESGVSARFDLDGDDDALADIAIVGVRTFESPPAAQESVQADQAEDAETYDGEFDTPQDGNAAGLRGSGSLRELSIDGWDGYLLTRDLSLVFGGETQSPLSDSRIVLHGGPQVITVSANAAEDSDLDQEALARQLAEEYIARLRESA